MSYRYTDGYLTAQSDGYVRLRNDGYTMLVFDGYNIGFFTAAGAVFDSAQGIVYLLNRTTAPKTDPSGGGFFYSEDGDGYWRSPTGLVQSLSNTRIVRAFPSDANYTAVQADYQAKIMEFTGAIGAQRDVVLPLTSGYQWTVYNNTTGGFAVQFIGAAGTGVVVASGIRTLIYADGANIVKVTG